MEENTQIVLETISEKTGIDVAEISEETLFEGDLNVSEMELIEILTDLEESLEIELIEKKDNIETVGDLIEITIEQLE